MPRAALNFGHHFTNGPGYSMDGWGDGPLVIRHGSKEWWFEFSEMWGPTWLRKSDKEPSVRQPTREDEPFWKPFTAWREGGSRCRAVWSKPGRTDKAKRRILYWVCHVPRVTP